WQRDLARDGYPLPIQYGWRADLIALGMCGGATLLVVVLFPRHEALVLSSAVFGAIWLVWFACMRLFPGLAERPWRRFTRAPGNQALVGKFTCLADGRGFEQRTDTRRWLVAWRQCPGVERYEDAVYVRLDAQRSLIVPLRSFSDFDSFDEFARSLTALWVAGQDSSGSLVDDSFGVRVSASVDDLLAIRVRRRGPPLLGWHWLWLPPAALIFISAWANYQSPHAAVLGLLSGLQIAAWLAWRPLIWPWFAARSARREFEDLRNQGFLTNARVAIDEAGITDASDVSLCHTAWPAVQAIQIGIERTIVRDGVTVYIVPRRAFETEDGYVDFIEEMVRHYRAATHAAA
ncbi:MAG: hypothetical protein ACRDHF_12710, partial [Tepidiformaceae bacterium]